ncbi:MAG: class D sortase [Oscillospiraceae bacterium]|nr:class D sortase [Oscillospiraceae bacterium]
MKRFVSLASLALCLMLTVCTPALAADYTFEGQEGSGYAESTSVDYVYTADGGAQPNEDHSKDAVQIPPAFGVSGIYALNAIGASTAMNPGSAVISGGNIVYPGAADAPMMQMAAAQTVTAFTDLTADLYYADGSLGTLKIPAIGLTVSIYEGTDSAALAKGAGHFSETSIWDGNVALAGHNRGVNCHFGEIHTLSIGDTITLTTALGTRTYEVTSVAKVSVTDREALVASAENRITLYTCVRNQSDLRWCVQAVEVG